MSPMTDAERQRQTDDAYRAVGRYMVEFSRLIGTMRRIVGRRLTLDRMERPGSPGAR